MKNRLALIVLILGVGLLGRVQALPVLQFNPSGPHTVASTDTLSVTLQITDVGSEIVSAFDLDVLYDSSLLSVASVNFDPASLLGGPSYTLSDWIVPGPGTLNVWLLSLLSDADIATLQAPSSGTFSLLTIDFSALGDGITGVAIGPLSVADGKDVKGFNNIPILPNPVPEPTPLALLACGLAGLAAVHATGKRLARRRRLIA